MAFAFAGDRRASMIVTFALMLPVLLGAGSFALDMGAIFLDQRALQAATDAIALAAAERPVEAPALARRLLEAAGQGDAVASVAFGAIDADPRRDRAARFREGPGSGVRVSATKTARLYLAGVLGVEAPRISARSDASLTPIVSMAAGGRLASVDPPLVNALIAPAFGGKIDLSLMDYRGLARSTLELGRLLSALDRDAGGGGAATAGAVLARPVRPADLFRVASAELGSAGDPVGAASLRQLAQRLIHADGPVALADILSVYEDLGSLDVAYPGRALGARVSALGLVSAVFGERAGGNRLDAGLALPGLAEVGLQALLGEGMASARPLAVGDPNAAVETAQLRLRARIETKGLLAGLDLPVEIVAAGGRARVLSATCGATPAEREVRVAVEPGLARLSIGAWTLPLERAGLSDRLAPADVVSTPLLAVSATASLAVRRNDSVILRFGPAEIGSGTVKTARTAGIARSLVASLLGETDIAVRPLGLLPVPLGPAAGGLRAALDTLARPLDDLLDETLAALGVGLGEMDVRVDDLVCREARIVG